jgi:hypothetical protein
MLNIKAVIKQSMPNSIPDAPFFLPGTKRGGLTLSVYPLLNAPPSSVGGGHGNRANPGSFNSSHYPSHGERL